jgi:tetratricopeptide (TPR) repeat protein
MPLYYRDMVNTFGNGKVEIVFREGLRARMREGSLAGIMGEPTRCAGSAQGFLHLMKGDLVVTVGGPDRPYVSTPETLVKIENGTILFRRSRGESICLPLDGSAAVLDSQGKETPLSRGTTARIGAGNSPDHTGASEAGTIVRAGTEAIRSAPDDSWSRSFVPADLILLPQDDTDNLTLHKDVRVGAVLDEIAGLLGRGIPCHGVKAADLDGAARRLERILETKKSSFVLLRVKGDLLAASGRTSDAVVAYEEALRFRPWDLPARCNLALLREGTGDREGCLAALNDALSRDHDNTLVLSRLAGFHVRNGDIVKGEGILQSLCEKNPEDWENRWALARCRNLLRKRKEAIADYRAVLHVRPDSARARAELGFLLYSLGDNQGGVMEMTKALGASGLHLEGCLHFALLLLKEGRNEEAFGFSERARELEPDEALASLSASDALCLAGRLDEALARLDAALALEPENCEFHLSRARLLLALERTDEAVGAIMNALALDRENPHGNYLLGCINVLRHEKDPALTRFRNALHGDDRLHEAHYRLALLLAEDGSTDRALYHLRKAVTIRSDSALYHSALGFAYQKSGDLRSAEKHYKEAYRLNPSDPLVLLNLSVIYRLLDQPRRSGHYMKLYREATGAAPK